MVTQQMSLDCIRSTLNEAGQGHVLRFYDKLDAAEQEALLGQLKMIPIKLLGDYFREATAENAGKEEYKLLPPNSSEVIKMMANEDKWEEWQNLGMTAIKDGKVAVVTLAGGQGTRLGSSLPKGCYKIGLLSDKSLFQLQAERILRLAALTGTQVQWYVMTSAPTHADTLHFFQANNYFGLSQERVQFFQQGFLPAFDLQGKIMMKSKGSVSISLCCILLNCSIDCSSTGW
jgi:UDP-N-acetylglucosamine/UDP-N-acetylgalactosamine diphosphorylase